MPKTSWEIYNGKIKDLRDEGKTLQQIGDSIGRTRERVRQILVEKYGTADSECLTTKQVSELVGRSKSTINNLRIRGIITSVNCGRWKTEVVDIILNYYRCRI